MSLISEINISIIEMTLFKQDIVNNMIFVHFDSYVTYKLDTVDNTNVVCASVFWAKVLPTRA